MIDLHCHLLPGIDDGPETLQEALDLARSAVAGGIRRAVVTPHIHPGRWDNDFANIRAAYESFKFELKRHGISLKLDMAAEVRVCAEILPLLVENRLPFLGHYQQRRVLLLEFPHSHIPPGSDQLMRWLAKQGIQPMIAHPERNKEVIGKFSRIYPYVELGCLFQVTSASLAGQFGPAAQERAWEMWEAGWITVLASDAHNIKHRPPNLDSGRDAIARLAGEEAAWRLVRERPAQILGSATD